MTRTRAWLAGIAGFLLLSVTALYFFDWNLARPYIARKVADSTGRSFAINGDLDVRLSLRPRIIVNGIALGNAAWSKDPVMAEIKRVDFRVDLLKLLRGQVAFPELALSEPRVLLEVDKDGTPNWVFAQRGKEKQREPPAIGALAIDRGSVKYRDPRIGTDLALAIDTRAAAEGQPDSMLELSGKGRFKGMPTSFRARGEALLELRRTDEPYALKGSAMLGTTKASLDGTLRDPLHLKGEEINFRLEGSDLALLYPIVGVPIPPTPPYTLAGFLSHSGDLWTFKRFKGRVGSSDVSGNFSVDRSKTPQSISADLVSHNIDMKDLGGLVGAHPSASPPPADKVLPVESFNLEKLRAANVDVRFKGARIVTGKMPIENMEAHLIVKDGTLKLAPLNFEIAGGSLVTEIAMDASKPRIVTQADITAKGLNLDQLVPSSKLKTAASTGTMGGRAKLDASGNSLAEMLGTANGEAALIMDGGSVSELYLRLSSLDIANSLLRLLGGDKQAPIRCMVANFKATDGDFKVRDLVLDTPKVNVTGEGNVNFADESLNLKLVSQSKGFSLASLRGPIVVSGTFKEPVVRPEMGRVATRGGFAAALGALTAGIGTLIPLLEFGKDQDSNCAALMNQAKAEASIKQSDIGPGRSTSHR